MVTNSRINTFPYHSVAMSGRSKSAQYYVLYHHTQQSSHAEYPSPLRPLFRHYIPVDIPVWCCGWDGESRTSSMRVTSPCGSLVRLAAFVQSATQSVGRPAFGGLYGAWQAVADCRRPRLPADRGPWRPRLLTPTRCSLFVEGFK